MFGGTGKLGRSGRGGGAGKRSIHSAFHTPPLNRASAPPSSRLSIPSSGVSHIPRGRNTTNSSSAAATSSPGTETTSETFSLVTGNPINFAMIIRLAPDLVEEIKRVEEQGSSAKIKFDPYANNPTGNVINVGGKEFKFTWSHEPGDLCDIYEEQSNGEDQGKLIESGCAWRKLNVQRILDESTKKHVKMLSEEAERKHNSRKSIVLDAKNPSMKNPIKALAASETNSWRTQQFKNKKEPPYKKQKTEPSPGPLKSRYKSNLSTTMTFNEQSIVSSPKNVQAIQAKDKITKSEKDLPKKVEKQGQNGKMDLKTMLESLLKENPSGMSLKALEKAIGDTYPNSVKQIEPIIKKIAIYQAPGKYIFKQGGEILSFKKPSPKIRFDIESEGVKMSKSGSESDVSNSNEDVLQLDVATCQISNKGLEEENVDPTNSCLYSKYGKAEPEFKEPIKNYLQYEEYVQEYNDKYKSYFSLNKILESYRNEFSQLGKDLEASKGIDTNKYYDLLAKLKDSYKQCGAKHKRLKKIFIVLHAELKNLKDKIKDFADAYEKD